MSTDIRSWRDMRPLTAVASEIPPGAEAAFLHAIDEGPRPARDVPPGSSWAFRGHRTQADIVGEV